MAKSNIIRVGDVEIHGAVGRHAGVRSLQLLPDHPRGAAGSRTQAKLTDEHKVRFNLGSYLIRSSRADDPRRHRARARGPAETPDCRGASCCATSPANGVRPDQVDMVVMTHLHRDHVGWNLLRAGRALGADVPEGASTG